MGLTTIKYKQTEVGLIPEDWDCVKMGDVGNTIIGLTYSPKDITDYGTLVLRSSNVQNNQLAYENNVFVDMDLPQRVIVKEDDILICVRNGSKKLIGKCALIDKKAEGYAFGAFMSIYRSEFSKYIFYSFQSNVIQRQIDATMGATINQLTNRDLFEFKIPLPKKPEQKAIAQVLSDTYALMQALEKKIAKKKQIKKGVMQKLLTPKKGWEVKSLGEITEIYTGKKNNQDKVKNGRYPFFVRSQKVESINTYSFDGEAILVPGEGNIGKIFHYINGKFDFHQRVYKISDFRDGYSGKYIYRYISEYFGMHAMENSVKATVDSLRLSTFKVFEIPFPPTFEEQTLIAKILEDIDIEIENLEQKLSKYQLAKQGKMQQLLTGKIRLV
jgi:type I restriction enzyme, S subunit